jgi:putative SOS response-associated peptidase YedK
LIVADGFYEFTDPTDLEKNRRDKWSFTKTDEPIFCFAGIWRETNDGRSHGPDIVPYQTRQIIIHQRDAWNCKATHLPDDGR